MKHVLVRVASQGGARCVHDRTSLSRHLRAGRVLPDGVTDNDDISGHRRRADRTGRQHRQRAVRHDRRVDRRAAHGVVGAGADQDTTNWYYYAITQTGDAFTVTDSLNCGLVVDGTTTVTLERRDAARRSRRRRTRAQSQGHVQALHRRADCDFAFDRTYNLRGANKATYLTDVVERRRSRRMPLSAFPALPTAPPGMEDWDADDMDGITLSTGIGNRYVAQRDWNEQAAPWRRTPPSSAARASSPSSGTARRASRRDRRAAAHHRHAERRRLGPLRPRR